MVQSLKMKMKEQKGFTLIELLAVIVILGIIAAIAIPSITHIINNSKSNAIKADAKMILNAAKLYQADGHTIGSGANGDPGVSLSTLENGYIDQVPTFDSSNPAATVINDGGVLKFSGTGTKDSITLNFTNIALTGIDGVTN